MLKFCQQIYKTWQQYTLCTTLYKTSQYSTTLYKTSATLCTTLQQLYTTLQQKLQNLTKLCNYKAISHSSTWLDTTIHTITTKSFTTLCTTLELSTHTHICNTHHKFTHFYKAIQIYSTTVQHSIQLYRKQNCTNFYKKKELCTIVQT